MPRLLAPGLLFLLALPILAAAEDATRASLDEIYNYHAVDDSLSTSGQVTPEQVPALQAGDVALVVNLAVADAERNAQEAFAVTSAGIAYTQIPVAWDAPTLADLALFFAVMDGRGDRRTLVHCFANFRASAFTYLYRTLRLGVPEPEARADMEAIWTEEAWAEYPQWPAFIEQARAHYGALEVDRP
ncbi:MAG TPA: protein tyrosine phosphatase family protein [Pseudomonadales bacterium]|nr:protein tyrosine phosphatase family protein [Pseudomonadales bacterium]